MPVTIFNFVLIRGISRVLPIDFSHTDIRENVDTANSCRGMHCYEFSPPSRPVSFHDSLLGGSCSKSSG